MNKAHKLTQKQLDKKLGTIAKSGIFVPSRGWIQAIRETLGMSQSQLAKRLKITRQTMGQIEKSETAGTLELKTLKKVADALGCDLGYALLPRQPLESFFKEQALAMAKRIINETEKHMRLEKQGTSSKFQQEAVAELAEELMREGGKKIWGVNGQED